ncbi:MAG: hypothetical protein A3F31_04505 [Candidatus Levybacteria bacterium RIFCSPHIGHO2_12_FULL_38_12]|nr:MAG: hypothetical protein A2770_04190 [Candidatus Levybacteria bacterium RIFCSPHIGHO2_01_FULL_38_12]OGH21829.1 MAG: hypothetical protein A3D75_01400 [Candidatus Levybacteria bacterium RIFCSPHIGHO2_02_FULL_37_18]OGH22514.1 MAG: hypothetical protein A3F31_04505 [Candidatus Levybacteria bacterium RIFCSPHIGHO2_12_FULL_38_12]OGH33450.1 MAG: hypothetical protein A3A47_04350 [Candidatus Levybacteria bacterium RIFCSPLOWO2_01_FULL_37_20]OGH44051.1 MAG: hypothetical protein A3J14_04875 [Candidatus Lev
MDTANTLYSSLKTETDLRNLVISRTPESLYLEFKQKSNAKKGNLDQDDKKNFYKALSGFANSDGGVLVWGVKTRKRSETASRLIPINQIDLFLQSLKSSLLMATTPMIEGVLVEKIEKDGSSSRGYIKCLIPASSKAPHRNNNDREYYKRSVEGFYRLEHFDLEDMFGRKLKPVLDLSYEVVNPHLADTSIRELKFYFKNEGRAVAKYTGFMAMFMQNLEVVSVTHQLQNVSSMNRYQTVSYSDNLGVIHPNGISTYLGSITFKFPDPQLQITGNLQFYCDGMMAVNKIVVLEVEQLNSIE